MIDIFTLVLMVIALVAITSTAVYTYGKGYGASKEGYLLSLRNLGPSIAAISIGMAWTNSPAIFVAPLQAYNVGLVGWFWFMFGNALTLAVFAFAAQHIRATLPEGYTMAGYLRQSHGETMHKLYLSTAIINSVIVMCTALVAGSTMISVLSGIPKLYSTIALVALALTLSFRTGFRATVLTEVIKFVVLVGGFLALVSYLFITPDIKLFTEGLGGIKGTGADIFRTATAWTVFATFGIIAFMGQMSAPWADNNFIQRAFAFGGNHKTVWISFVLAAVIFTLTPIMTGMIGFFGVANQIALPVGAGQNAIIFIVNQMIGPTAMLVICFMVLLSTIAITDSQLTNSAALIRHDIIDNYKLDEETSLRYTRYALLLTGIIGVLIVNIPFVNLVYIFLLQNVFRAVLGLTTAGLIFKPKYFDGKITAAVLTVMIIACTTGFTLMEIYNTNKELTLPLVLAGVFATPILSALLSKVIR